MQILRLVFRPLSPLGTPIAGDTLFGQLCWALRLRHGETALTAWLQDYTNGKPFAVVSDAFPSGWLPRPTLPSGIAGRPVDPAQRKQARRRAWLPLDGAAAPLGQWLKSAAEMQTGNKPWEEVIVQNTIDRLTGTTGKGQFAPRQVGRIFHPPGALLDAYLCVDASRIDITTIRQALDDIGDAGYGRDASIGMGKFEIDSLCDWSWPARNARAAITLAPCAAEPAVLTADRCWYQPLTRFGRHGGDAALGAAPFKRPVLLMRGGAWLTFANPEVPPFHGRGLGGRAQPVSTLIPETVHQGYAPLVPVYEETS